MEHIPLHRIVLTGGPCGGKTTALSHITDRFRSLGYNVYVVPEMATTFILGGINPRELQGESYFRFQLSLTKAQLAMEDSFLESARASGKPSLIIYDRGTMDSAAFMTPTMWQALMDENGWSLVGLRDKRYDAVIHLTSAAVGATEFYTLATNKARSESMGEAAQLDASIREAWLGHPHLRIIDNYDDFNLKLKRVLAAISNVVGIPEPVENERKFLVKKIHPLTCRAETVDIEQVYLLSNDGVARIRKRGQHGFFTYTYTVKKYLAPGKNVELERAISGREYINLLAQKDPTRLPIIKRRTCFLWGNQYYELDCFAGHREGLVVLEAELEDDQDQLTLPPFLEIDREVTQDRNYSNFELAKEKC
jgi:CYTH domain-containing protein/predicted ATPase